MEAIPGSYGKQSKDACEMEGNYGGYRKAINRHNWDSFWIINSLKRVNHILSEMRALAVLLKEGYLWRRRAISRVQWVVGQ